MKKLIIALAAVAFAAVSQAATVNWIQNTTQINGDWSTGQGDMAPQGWTMYLFDSLGSGTSYADMQTALAAATTSAGYTAWQTAMGTSIATGTIVDDGTLAVNGVTMTMSDQNKFTGYGILLDAGSITDAKYALLVGEQTWDKGASVTVVSLGEDYSIAGGNFINGLNYDTKENWTAVGVPEPTSGLLLLLGMAGLALRRRRA